jgi:hypothetical protein
MSLEFKREMERLAQMVTTGLAEIRMRLDVTEQIEMLQRKVAKLELALADHAATSSDYQQAKSG